MDYIIYFAITIGILVFVHEFGHFIAAKLSGMRADVFAIGFGKRLFGWNKINGFTFGDLPDDWDGKGHTDYRLSLLPLGGYVKIAGMVDESFDTKFADKEPQPYEFRARPIWQKIFVISAGVAMNLILALFVFWGTNFFHGKLITKTTTIGYVEPHSYADSAGLKENDKIISINGNTVTNWEELRTDLYVNTLGENLDIKLDRNGKLIDIKIPRSKVPSESNGKMFIYPAGIYAGIDSVLKGSPADKAMLKSGDILLTVNNKYIFAREQAVDIFTANKEKPLPVLILRNKDSLALSVTPGSDGKIGAFIGPVAKIPLEYKTYGFFESFYYAGLDIVHVTELTLKMLGKVFTGGIAFGQAFGGPVKIAQYAVKSADNGILSFLYFLAMLSLSLAIINIMPFPVLDGGHLIIILIEGILKREISIKVKIAIQNTGFVLLLMLMAFIIYSDIINL